MEEQRQRGRTRWELTSWSINRRQRELTGHGRSLSKPQVCSQWYTHKVYHFPNNSTNWGPSIQARTSMGNILIKPTTAYYLHLCLLYHILLFKLLSKSSLKSSSFIKPSKSLCTRIMYQCQRKSLGYVFKIWDILLFYSTYIYILFVRFLKTFSQHECPWIFFEFAKWL